MRVACWTGWHSWVQGQEQRRGGEQELWCWRGGGDATGKLLTLPGGTEGLAELGGHLCPNFPCLSVFLLGISLLLPYLIIVLLCIVSIAHCIQLMLHIVSLTLALVFICFY